MEKPEREDFGSFLRGLRQHKRYSLKSLANEMNVDYTYLSKLENGHSTPSERLIEKVAAFFDYDKEELMVRAGKIPEDVLRIISDNPKEAIQFLSVRSEINSHFSHGGTQFGAILSAQKQTYARVSFFSRN